MSYDKYEKYGNVTNCIYETEVSSCDKCKVLVNTMWRTWLLNLTLHVGYRVVPCEELGCRTLLCTMSRVNTMWRTWLPNCFVLSLEHLVKSLGSWPARQRKATYSDDVRVIVYVPLRRFFPDVVRYNSYISMAITYAWKVWPWKFRHIIAWF